jgi:hypothetical protein
MKSAGASINRLMTRLNKAAETKKGLNLDKKLFNEGWLTDFVNYSKALYLLNLRFFPVYPNNTREMLVDN